MDYIRQQTVLKASVPEHMTVVMVRQETQELVGCLVGWFWLVV